MKEHLLIRGMACLDIHEAIFKRLNLPTNWKELPEGFVFTQAPPGLFFAQGRKSLPDRERYAVKEAGTDRIPCVVILHVNEANFSYIEGRVWNARMLPLEVRVDRPRTEYQSVEEYGNIHNGLIAVALDGMSNEDLLGLHTEVGFKMPDKSEFEYKPYAVYLKNKQLKEPNPQDFEEWLKKVN